MTLSERLRVECHSLALASALPAGHEALFVKIQIVGDRRQLQIVELLLPLKQKVGVLPELSLVRRAL